MQDNNTLILLPELIGERLEADGISLSLRIPEDLTYFKGHFDEIPVVAGVVQIHWAMHYARQYLDLKLSFSYLEVVKFKELLLAGNSVVLSLRYIESAHKLEFCFQSEHCEYSSGRIYFHENIF